VGAAKSAGRAVEIERVNLWYSGDAIGHPINAKAASLRQSRHTQYQ
jgi:hypothetical protein